MSKILSRDEILALARLSKLQLTDSEITTFQRELSEILDYFALLQNIDTKNLEPTHQIGGLVNVMRSDIVEDQITNSESLLAIAPRTKDSYVQVERMI